MSNTTALTPSLRSRLEAVARRVRLLRIVRGLGLVVLVLVLGGAAAMLADYFLPLPILLRRVLFTGWAALGAALFALGLVIPLLRRLDLADLAAVVEQKYPELAERLTTAVELAGTRDEYHGSPALIALLVSDTAQRTSRLNFLPAVSARDAVTLGVAALAVVALTLSPAAVWTSAYANQGKRFFLAWSTPPKIVPYDLEVLTGDVLTARGKPVMFRVRVLPRQEKAALPSQSTLVLIDDNGQETRLSMAADRTDTFFLEHKVARDGQYRIEAGEVVSATYDIQAILPVELADDSPTVTITAPQYARETILEQHLNGVVDVSALKHSDVTFAFRFTRPAVAAFVEWTVQEIKESKDGSESEPKMISRPVTLAEDRLSGTFTLPALVTGTYRVVLEAEHGIRTELDAKTLTVRIDQPPQVVKFAGKEELQAILPYERLPLEIIAGDDIGVARADFEYTVNNGEVKTEAMTLVGADRQEVMAKHVFQLAGKVQENDEISYRLRIQDNLPKEYGGPQTVYYPADRWLRVKVAKKASPLREQEILAQRDDINKRLEAIKADLLREQRGVYKVRQESRNDAILGPEHANNLKQLRQNNQSTENALRELARETSATPALERIADQAQNIADREMQQSDAALQNAADRKKQPPQRDNDFQTADKALTSALQKLEELKKATEKLTQERLDQQKVEMLADREKQLAERAAELSAKDLVRDPLAKQELEQIKREQKEVAAELQQLSEKSEALRNALDEARAEQAKQLAEQAKELAAAERDLAKATQETNEQRNGERFAELARKQQELANKAEKLAQDTRQPAQTAKTNPLKTDEAKKAVEELKQGNAEKAMRRQEQTAQELERLATALDKLIEPAKDLRDAARQLAKEQRDLRDAVRKMNEAARAADQGQKQNPLGDLTKQQTEIAKQAAELAKNVGQDQGQQAPTTQQAQQAQQSAQQAANKMQAGAMPAAQQAGRQTAETLRQLAQNLAQTPRGKGDPNAPDPVQQARQLAQKQEDLNRKLDPLANDSDAQRAQQQARQQELQQQAKQLDQDLNKLGQQMNRSPQASRSAQQASKEAQQAQKAMQQAGEQQNQGNKAAAQQSQQNAAQALDRAAQQASQASQQQMASRQPGKPQPGGQQTGQAVQQAQNQMGQAQSKLTQGQPQGAQAAMQQAAQSLQQAAQQMAAQQSGPPKEMGRPGEFGASASGRPDASILGPEMQKYAGKTWGELPGELRTKIVQDMTAKYGDDYARMIKLYFEQLADTKKK